MAWVWISWEVLSKAGEYIFSADRLPWSAVVEVSSPLRLPSLFFLPPATPTRLHTAEALPARQGLPECPFSARRANPSPAGSWRACPPRPGRCARRLAPRPPRRSLPGGRGERWVERGAWREGRGGRGVEGGVWREVCGGKSVEGGAWREGCGGRGVAGEVWREVCGGMWVVDGAVVCEVLCG